MKDGKWQMNLSTDPLEDKFVDIGKVTPEQIEMLTSQRETLEEQARLALTFQERFDMFLQQLQILLIPALKMAAEKLESFSNWLDSWSDRNKRNVAYILTGAAALFSAAAFVGLGMSMGIGFKMTSGIGGATGVGSNASGLGVMRSGKGSMMKMLGAAAVITSVGAAVMMIGKGIQAASEGFASLAESMSSLPNKHLMVFEGLVTKIGVGALILVGGLAALAFGLVAFGATASVMLPATVILLALGAAAYIFGAAVSIAARGMSVLADSMTRMLAVEGGGGSLFMMGAGIANMAAGLTLLSNPFAMIGMGMAMSFIRNLGKNGPGVLAAADGVKSLSENLTRLKTSMSGFDEGGGMFDKLTQIDKMITRTQSKPIQVIVKGDLGGRLDVNIVGAATERKILLSDGKFLNNLTNEIEKRVDLNEKVSGK